MAKLSMKIVVKNEVASIKQHFMRSSKE